VKGTVTIHVTGAAASVHAVATGLPTTDFAPSVQMSTWWKKQIILNFYINNSILYVCFDQDFRM